MQFHTSPYSPEDPDLGDYGLTAQRTNFREVRTLRKGAKGGDVEQLHMALDSNSPRRRYVTNAGAMAEMIDGHFGPKTETAVEDFQKDNGLQQDGIVGSNTWSKLSTASITFAVQSDSGSPSTKLTASGDDATRKGIAAIPVGIGLTEQPWFWPVVAGGSILLIGGTLLYIRKT